MMENQNHFFGKFFKRHPVEYHAAAFIIALASIGITLTMTLMAEGPTDTTAATSGTSSNTSGTSSAITSCSYNYSEWSVCQPDGKHTRAVTGMSPSGCVQTTAPKIMESCSYAAPQCGFSYSEWGACQSNKMQSRTVLTKSPTGCQEYNKPELERSCVYVAPALTSSTGAASTSEGSTTNTSTMAPLQCIYEYSAWSICKSEGKRYRNVNSQRPSGCQEYLKPVTEQACVYEPSGTTTDPAVQTTPTSVTNSTIPAATAGSIPISSTTTSSGAPLQTSATSTSSAGISTNTTGDAVTPPFTFLNIADGMTISGNFDVRGVVNNASQVEFYLVPVGSNTYKYAGTASHQSSVEWRLKLSSASFPNGEFYLRAKVKNSYGEYGSGQRKILIANGDRSLVTSSATTDGFQTLGMTDTEKRDILRKFQAEAKIPETVMVSDEKNDVDTQRRQVLQYCLDHSRECQTEKDQDHDGLSDVDEIRFGSNPQVADTDLDGFIDGDEVKNGFDPVKYSGGDKSDKIVFESPQSAGEVKKDLYKVQTVSVETKEGGEKRMRLTGTGLPNSFVTIYVYSNPIILTVKTDNDGNWTYELDKEMEDGSHEVYVAITDNTGKITAKSEPLPFVKTAQAIEVRPLGETPAVSTDSPTESRFSRDLWFLIPLILAGLAAALAIIGLARHRSHLPSDNLGV